MTSVLLWVLVLQNDVLVVPSERPEVPDAYVEGVRIDDEVDVQWVQTAIIDAALDRGLWGDRLGPSGLRSIRVHARDPAGRWVPLPRLLPAPEAPEARPHELKSAAGGSPVVRSGASPGQVAGSLSGKTIYLSQGHGWHWSDVLGRWASQRGNTHDIVEDFVGAEGANHFLIPMLQNAGALVFPMREPDPNPDEARVDETEATLDGAWTEGPAGWAPFETLETGQSPFELGSTRIAVAAQTATAVATFTPELPTAGEYGVSVAWSAAPDRAADARVVVVHAAGEAEFQVDQRRHGSTWVYLGRFRLLPGVAAVRITNESAFPGSTVSVDAVRFGGGEGRIDRGDGSFPAKGPTSGRPRWEECSRYHAQLQGAPSSVYDYAGKDSSDDVSTRSRYAAWQHEDGEDAVFVSWHSNAPNPGRGTSTWVYGPDGPGAGPYDFTGVAGSEELANAVHGELVDRIRAEWEPGWKDRGIHSAWFGEINPKHNPEMPSTLVETAFHDTEADAILLAEPRFRYTLARGIYRGIVRYFAERDGIEPSYLPQPPMHLRVSGLPNGVVRVAWAPSDEGAPATGFRVWLGDGFGATPAIATAEHSALVEGLTPGQPIVVFVTATNDGGESFPSAVLTASAGCNGPADRALVVQGFTRYDRFSLPREDLSPWSLGSVMRLIPQQVNTFDYAVDHGEALLAAGIPFDSVEATAIEDGIFAMAGYGMVDWILGEESTVDETFSAAEQASVAAYLDGGGKLLVTGAELAWDLDEKGTSADRAFCEGYLKVLMESDDAETYALESGEELSGAYDVAYPDVLVPMDGAEVLWSYEGGAVAGIAWSGAFDVVTAGFPLEAIAGAEARAGLMAQAVDSLDFDPTLDLCPEDTPDDDPSSDPSGDPDATTGTDGAGPDADGSARLDPAAPSGAQQLRSDSGCATSPAGGGAKWNPFLLGLLLFVVASRRSVSSGART